MIVKDQQDEIQGFLRDASNMPGGSAERVYFPESEDEVAALLEDCYGNNIPVTASGAGTGLAGGRVPFGGVVLSTARLNRILEIDSATMRAVLEPGVVLGEFQREVEQYDLLYPPDPTERNCFVGATVATNSSGARTFKYGPTRNYITGLNVVLATGEQLVLRRGEVFAEGLRLTLSTTAGRQIDLDLPELDMPATKHAAGYYIRPGMDAIDLFIGSEGTLGIVTRITTRLLPLPTSLFSGIVFFAEEDATLGFVEAVREKSRRIREGGSAGLDARALEYIDRNALEFIRDRFPTIPSGAEGGAIWFEQETDGETEEKLIEEWYELMTQHNALIDDSWFAIGVEDQRRMREFRHAVPSAVYEHISEHGQTKLGTDMAVPDGALRELLKFYRDQFQESGIRNIIYGHIGNNHLHANMFVSGDSEFVVARTVYDRMVRKSLSLGGTISAEHGVGKLKTKYLLEMFGTKGVEGMHKIKQMLDPHGILGRGTLFQDS
jgi:D-lactate dehydrogenase (cytochrome)